MKKDNVEKRLPDTDDAFKRFIENRSPETYQELLETFVLEVMSTRRPARFPTTSASITKMLEGAPLTTAIRRDSEGRPYLVYLTETASCENSECEMDIVASAVFLNAIKDPMLFGIALNPWDGGGACFPNEMLMAEVARLDQEMLGGHGSEETTNHIHVIIGDITKQAVDAIVNAANEGCLGGGGVDRAIHLAAGLDLLKACLALPEVRPGVRCPTGEAVITTAGRLPCRFVIHTAGPDCGRVRDVAEQDRLLVSSYRRSLEVAKANGLKSVAFPSISTGIFGFPLVRATKTVARVVTEFLAANPDMSFTMCVLEKTPRESEMTRQAYVDAFAAVGKTDPTATQPVGQTLTEDDMTFLEQVSKNLAFIMQRINRQLDTGNQPKPGVKALEGFRAIDYNRLAKLSGYDSSARVSGLVRIYDAIVLSERAGWTLRVFPEYWDGALYDKEHPENATSYARWAYVRPAVAFRPCCEGPVENAGFPAALTRTMLDSFTETLNGSTRPHKGSIAGVSYVLKCGSYSPTSSDAHVHNEYVADCFLRAAGCNVPESREYRADVSGRGVETVRLSRFVEGANLLGNAASLSDEAIRRQVLDTYPLMSFIAAIDTYQHCPMDNVLVDAENRLWFVDNGASFDFSAKGARKGWYFKRTDIHDPQYGYFSLLRHKDQGNLRQLLKGVSDEELRLAAAKYDFTALVKTLPADLQHPNLVAYASQLDSWSRV